MWHLLMAQQQESFLPFSMAAKSLLLPKPRGKKKSKTSWSSSFPSEPRGPFPHFRTSWYSPLLLQNHMDLYLSTCFRTSWVYSFLQSCMVSSFLPQNLVVLFPSMAAVLRFKSQHPSSFAALFLTPPTVSYTCQHPRILPALLGCHSKSGQVWPHGMEPIISKLSTQGL